MQLPDSLQRKRAEESIDWPKILEGRYVFPGGYLFPFALDQPFNTLTKLFIDGLTQDRTNAQLSFQGIDPWDFEQTARAMVESLTSQPDTASAYPMVQALPEQNLGLLRLGPNTHKIIFNSRYTGPLNTRGFLTGFPERLAQGYWHNRDSSILPVIHQLMLISTVDPRFFENEIGREINKWAVTAYQNPELFFGRRGDRVEQQIGTRRFIPVAHGASRALLDLNVQTMWEFRPGIHPRYLYELPQAISAELRTIPSQGMTHDGLLQLADSLYMIPNHTPVAN